MATIMIDEQEYVVTGDVGSLKIGEIAGLFGFVGIVIKTEADYLRLQHLVSEQAARSWPGVRTTVYSSAGKTFAKSY
jgi:hypothetical protein